LRNQIDFPAMDKKGSEADVIFNRASVALAKSQRLIASWLPPKSEEERRNEKTEEEKEREEQEIFTPVPELYVSLSLSPSNFGW